MADLSNKRIVVTGGSAGLGLAMVTALREAQADVTAVARYDRRLEAPRDTGAHTLAGDATDAVLIDRVVAERDPDVLILNAGARVGNTVRMSTRVAAPSGSNVRNDSQAFGSPRVSPCSIPLRSGGAISGQEIHYW